MDLLDKKGFSDRLASLIPPKGKGEFARRICVRAHQLSRYLDSQVPSPEILARIAKATGRSIDWLLTGNDQADQWRDLLRAALRIRRLKYEPGNLDSWAKERGEIEALVSRLEDDTFMLEAAHTTTEAGAIYIKEADQIATLFEAIIDMTEEELSTLRRCAAGLRSGDDQVRTHLIGQLKIIEEAVAARRAAEKQKEIDHRQAG